MKRLAIVLPVLVLFFSIETSWGGVPWRSRAVAPVTLEVTNGDDDGPGSLREAIRDAAPDSTIEFTFTGTISLTSDELLIDKNLTIEAPGSSVLIIMRDSNASKPFRLIEVASGATVSVSGVSLVGGFSVDAEGGGILNSGLLSLSDVRIVNNAVIGLISVVDGGGCANSTVAQLTLTNCTLTGNTCDGSGGGILNGGDLTVHNSTISNNTAAFGGGIQSTGTATITNSTIVSNAATVGTESNSEGGFGGGLMVNGPTAVLVSDTVTGNSAIYAGGGMDGGTITLTNCIVAGNSVSMFETLATADLGGEVLSGGYNLIGISTGSSGLGPHDLTGTVDAPLNAHLGPLQDNGGLTFTMALLPGSPAIDQGVSQGLSTDQRGMPRTADQPNIPNASGGDGTDIGAFELPVIAPTLGNISTRLLVGTGDNVLIAGFIVTGTQPKKVILRAIGPSLPVPGAMADPTLELHDSTQAVIATNDNWKDSPDKQAIIDSTIPPTNDNESAIVITLNPGSYTAVVQGANGGTGVALVEVYDLDHAADSKLGNLSTRGLVQTDDDVMIGGVIVLGTEPTNFVIRAIGPSLPLTGTLADPTVELHDGNGAIIAFNDNWKDTQEAEIEASELAPADDFESAIAAPLTPGAYTTIVRGNNNTTGVALVEIYQLE
ncbi:MAG: choice-of-anchor Q domain-containing protein [Chthoniobacterales bacterium]